MISVNYNGTNLIIKKEILLQINYFNYMFEYDVSTIDVNYDVDVEYCKILFKFVDDNQIINNLNYDVLSKILKLAIYFDYQYFIDTVSKLPFDEDKIINVNHLYQFYLNTNQIKFLLEVLKNVKIPELNFNEMSLLQYYDLSKYNNQKLFKLFDYRHLLDYEAPLYFYETYQTTYINNYQYKNFLTKELYDEKFTIETNNIFKNFKWDNVCIAGGFLYGLINQVSHSLLENSDIDLYIYHSDEQARKETWQYVMSYFSQYGAQYYDDRGLILIKIQDLIYPIQIILMDYNNPVQILTSFDMNYCKLYYNGEVYADIGCLVAFKHQLAICDIKFVNTIDTRIYKTIKKGLRLLKSDDINKNTTLIQNDMINLNLYKVIHHDQGYLYLNYNDLVWYNYSHTMKIYTLKQALPDYTDQNIDVDNQMKCNKFLTSDLLDNLKLKKLIRINTYEHFDYEEHGQSINLFVKINHQKNYNIMRDINKNITYLIQVDQSTADLIQLYIDKIIGNTLHNQLLRKNKLFIHIYDLNLLKILNDNNSMLLICQIKHKIWYEKHYIKFVLTDIKLP